ncbi:MAG: hypothetical protein NTX82_04830 [Candidatus Parcubacteria bacterium]|nr:hypothetical protein [Candidatus Parcubacteria bacterium]
MRFKKTDFVVLRPDENGVWGFISFPARPEVDEFLVKDQKAVLVRFNVRIVGNNTPCETYADAEKVLADVQRKHPETAISLMEPHRQLGSTEIQMMYYDAERQILK